MQIVISNDPNITRDQIPLTHLWEKKGPRRFESFRMKDNNTKASHDILRQILTRVSQDYLRTFTAFHKEIIDGINFIYLSIDALDDATMIELEERLEWGDGDFKFD